MDCPSRGCGLNTGKTYVHLVQYSLAQDGGVSTCSKIEKEEKKQQHTMVCPFYVGTKIYIFFKNIKRPESPQNCCAIIV